MEYIIESIVKSKKVYKVTLNDGNTLKMSENTFTDFYFYVGKVINEEELSQIKKSISLDVFYEYSVNILSKRPYSCRDVYLKLVNIKKATSYQALEIINKLKDLNLLNDKKYSEILIDELNDKSFGYNRIIHELEKDGINKEDYNLNYDEDLELEKAKVHLNILVSKFKSQSMKKQKESLFNAYLHLGFKKDVINLVLSSINQYDLLGELNNLKKDYLKITIKMNEKQIKENKQKIIEKLLRKGYNFTDIKSVMEDER